MRSFIYVLKWNAKIMLLKWAFKIEIKVNNVYFDNTISFNFVKN